MQSEFNSQILAGGCSKNLENLFWTYTGTKKKGTKGFLKKSQGCVSLMILRVHLLLFEYLDLTMIRKLLRQVVGSCCLPGVFSFSFASSKACPECCRTLKKEGLLHILQSLCHHPKTSTAALASSWAMLMNIFNRAVRVLQDLQLIPGSGMAVQEFGR